MADPKNYQFDLPATGRPNSAPIAIETYPGIEKSVRKRSTQRRFHPVEGIRAVVIHATAGFSSADAVAVMKRRKSSFHYLVPDEDEAQHGEFIWRVVPQELAAWHVLNSRSHPDVWNGKQQINHWSVGIEVVNRQANNDEFSEWQIEATAKLVRYCWMIYPNLKHVVSHAKMDPDRRSDPGTLFPWQDFKSRVLDANTAPIPHLVAEALDAKPQANIDDACCMVAASS